MIDDFASCYRAVTSRDTRFDGRFVTAVTSTGIYCRPSCPAQTPKPANVRFYRLPAAAQAAGFRACRRCQPDAAPGSPEWDLRADLAARALRLIADGAADGDGVGAVARRLAVSERHLHRTLVTEVGVGPLALARTRRAQTARMLVETTTLPLTDVAFAAGFGSVRQFNDGFQAAFGCTPSQLRQRRRGGRDTADGAGTITVRLRHRPPYPAARLLRWLGARAVPGLERLDGPRYLRTLRLPRGVGACELIPGDGEERLLLRLRLSDLRDLAAAVQRCRWILDADADPAAVSAVLGADPVLAPLVAEHPGLRVPGAADGFELAVRAVLGQQVSLAAARTLLGRLVAVAGEPLPVGDAVDPAGGTVDPAGGTVDPAGAGPTAAGPWLLFPTAQRLASTDLGGVGIPASRQRTIRELAAAVAAGDLTLDRGADRAGAVRALRAIHGIGPWTASYVAMRALGDPDVLPDPDLVLRRSATALGIEDLPARAARWRPWRSYAAMYLWEAAGDPRGQLSPEPTERRIDA